LVVMMWACAGIAVQVPTLLRRASGAGEVFPVSPRR
jgi:hypothetical protein